MPVREDIDMNYWEYVRTVIGEMQTPCGLAQRDARCVEHIQKLIGSGGTPRGSGIVVLCGAGHLECAHSGGLRHGSSLEMDVVDALGLDAREIQGRCFIAPI